MAKCAVSQSTAVAEQRGALEGCAAMPDVGHVSGHVLEADGEAKICNFDLAVASGAT